MIKPVPSLFVYRVPSNLQYKSHQVPKRQCFYLASQCFCPIHWSQVLSWEWSCRWSIADAPATYVWSSILLPTKVRLILEVWIELLIGENCRFYITVSLPHQKIITSNYIRYTSTHRSLPGQNGRHFAKDILRCIFVNEKICILIKISQTPKGPIDNGSALV